MNTLEEKDETIRKLRHEIRIMQLALEERNKQLNAYHYVWCDAGCEGGLKDKSQLSEELVQKAEYQTRRLRSYWENYQYKSKVKRQDAWIDKLIKLIFK